MSKEPTPHELLEIIQNQAFKGIDLSQVLTMNDEQLCIFSLEQMERLRATRGSIAALWLSDQFLTSDRELYLMYNPHPWLDLAIEMKLPSQLPDLSDDEYRIAEWIFQMALLSHDLYAHVPFDVEQLGGSLKMTGDTYADDFRYANTPLIDWIRSAPYRRVAAMVCYIVMEQETNWAIQHNQAVQDFYAMEGWGSRYSLDQEEECEEYIAKCLDAMRLIVEHYANGRQAGLDDEEIRVLDAIFGFAPHNYAEEDFPMVREICEAAERHLPPKPYIKSEQGQRMYGNAVFDDLKKIFAKHEVDFDPSDLSDLTPGYLDKWVYDKYYEE